MSDEIQTVQLWGQRVTTTSAAIIWVRHDSNGLLSVVVNGQTFNGDTIDTNVDDGTGIVSISGLSANTKYPISIRVGGIEAHTGTIRTNPSVGTSFNVGIYGCWGNAGSPAVYDAIDNWDVCTWFALGDRPYTMSMSSRFVSAAVSLDTLANNTLDVINIAARATACTSDIAACDHSAEVILRDDDHDWHSGDDYQNSWESLYGQRYPINDPNYSAPQFPDLLTNQQGCNDIHALMAQAKRSWYKGNLMPTDQNLLDGEVPFPCTRDSATALASDHPVEFAVKVIGTIAFFVLGTIENKTQNDPWNGTDDEQTVFTPTIVGVKQRAAIEAAWIEYSARSDIDEIVTISPKSLNSSNGDGWFDYVADRTWYVELVDSYGKDHFFLASDYHQPNVFELSPTAGGVNATDTVTILDATFAPCGGRGITGPPPGARNSIWSRDTKAIGVLHYEAGEYIQFVFLDERGKEVYYSPRKYFNNPRFIQTAPPPKVN